jgi:hypothetical protein
MLRPWMYETKQTVGFVRPSAISACLKMLHSYILRHQLFPPHSFIIQPPSDAVWPRYCNRHCIRNLQKRGISSDLETTGCSQLSHVRRCCAQQLEHLCLVLSFYSWLLSCACYMPHHSHLSSFVRSRNICWAEQTMKLMQFSPLSDHVLPLRSQIFS